MRLGSRRTNFFVSSIVKNYLENLDIAKTTNHLPCLSVSSSENSDTSDDNIVPTGTESDKENFSNFLSCFNSYRFVNADHICARHRHR